MRSRWKQVKAETGQVKAALGISTGDAGGFADWEKADLRNQLTLLNNQLTSLNNQLTELQRKENLLLQQQQGASTSEYSDLFREIIRKQEQLIQTKEEAFLATKELLVQEKTRFWERQGQLTARSVMDEMERRERRRRKTLEGASLDASRVEIWKDILKLDGELLEKLSECFPSYPNVPTGSENFGSHIAKFLNSTFGRLSAKPHPSLKPLQTPDGPAVKLAWAEDPERCLLQHLCEKVAVRCSTKGIPSDFSDDEVTEED